MPTTNFKYGFFPTWYYITYPTVWASYKVPIYACDRLYNQTPGHGEADKTVAEGSTSGYATIGELYKEICDYLTFNPFTVTRFYLNNGAVTDDFMTGVINAFNGEYEERNGSYNGYNPEPAGSGSSADDLVNYCDLTTGTRGTNAFTGSYFTGGGMFTTRLMPVTLYSANDGVELEFQVWPESAIENSSIDLSGLFKYDGNYRLLITKVYIYKRDGRYYWYIDLHNYECTQIETDWMNDHLQDYNIGHIYEPDNPYDDHQKDGNEGGDGGFDNDSDPTPIPDLPAIDITSLGGIKLFVCSNSDIAALFSYLNSHTPGEAVLKMWQNPIQAVLACYILPYPVTHVAGGSITVLGMDTGVSADKANQWQQWNLGSVFVDYSCGNCFLDFEPYSSCQIYLPFIGIRKLNMDEVVGHTVGVVYQFDNTSGACVAYVTVGNSVKYSFAGSCAVGIPLTQQNWGQFYVAAATAAAGMLAGGIGAAAGAASALASGAGGLNAAAGAAQAMGQGIQGGGGLGAISAKPSVSRSGSISGAAAALAYPAPYLIIEYPDKAKVANPAPVTGLACGRTLSLGSLSGYNVIEHVHLHGIAATGPELDEIESLLYQGVVF